MTTIEEHNKYLGYAHLAFGALQSFMLLVMAFFSLIFLRLIASEAKGDFPLELVALVLVFSFSLQFLFTLPSIIAGYGLMKKRRWAKIASIIAGVFSAMSFPFGTAVTVYTFWFLFGQNGKALYEERPLAETSKGSDYFLSEPEDENLVGRWRERRREREYVPPKEMPNWRD